jgi:hypothetical protein
MFLAFSYDTYYPAGGRGDFIGAFDTFDEAAEAAKADGGQHCEVYDVAARKWSFV